MVVALREKALSIANEYADFAKSANGQIGRLREKLETSEYAEDEAYREAHDARQNAAAKAEQVSQLKEVIVASPQRGNMS